MTYSCPFCHGPLTGTTSVSLECRKCHRRYDSKYGIPILSKDTEFFYGEIAQPVMQHLISRTQTLGWDKAFIELLKTTEAGYSSHLMNYVTNESRAGWKYLLDIGAKSKVLDLGCGWGSTSISLSRTVAEVVAMDLTIERLVLLRERALLQGRTNIEYVCGGDTPCLPFPSEYFDAVILNGVLEWVPESRNGDPRNNQLNFLKEVARILSPTGQAYIGIENRLSYRYLMGQREDHTGLRYGALLPRRISNWYSQLVRSKPYRTYTYSIWGYKRLLKKAGFLEARFYAPIPDYRDFEHIVDLGSPVSSKFYYRPTGIKQCIKAVLLKHTTLAKWFCSSFCIVGGKGDTGKTFVESLLHLANERIEQSRGAWAINKVIRVRKTNTVLAEFSSASAISGQRAGAIARIPMEPVAESHVLRNFEALQYIHQSSQISKVVRDLVPQALFSGSIEGQVFTIETKLPGVPGTARDRSRKYNPLAVLEAVDLLARLHVESSELRPLDEVEFRRLIGNRFESLEAVLGRNGGGEVLCNLQSVLGGMLINRKLPFVLMHGDFWMGNLLVDPTRMNVTGIIDFDRAEERGLPYIDLLHFLIYRRIQVNKDSFCNAFRSLIIGNAFTSAERILNENYLHAVGLSEALTFPLAIIYLIHHTLGHVEKYRGVHQSWLQSNAFSLFREVSDAIASRSGVTSYQRI